MSSAPPFPVGTFPVRILAARQFARGNRVVGALDLEIATNEDPAIDGSISVVMVNTQVELLLDAPAGPSMAIVLRDLRLVDAWRQLVGVEDVPAGAKRPFPLLMKNIAFKSLNKVIRAEIIADRGPWGWKPRMVAVSIEKASDV